MSSLSASQVTVRFGIQEKTARLFMHRVRESNKVPRCKHTRSFKEHNVFCFRRKYLVIKHLDVALRLNPAKTPTLKATLMLTNIYLVDMENEN